MSKKHDNLFHKITDPANVDLAYKNTQKGRLKYKPASLKFSENLTVNLEALRSSVADGTYRTGEYHSFMVYEPKEREIFAPCFQDKVVQHMLNNVLRDVYEPCFIYDSYACIRNKGTHKAVNRISYFLRNAPKGSYIVKLDIKKFFYSIDRTVLKRLFRKKISCQQTLALMDRIADSAPGEVGLPLGNLTSQLFANIYLNEMDNFIKRGLSVGKYVRYADDAVAIVDGKPDAQGILCRVKAFVVGYLRLILHPDKSTIFPAMQGINTIGFKIFRTHRLLRDDCKRKIKRKARKMPLLMASGRIAHAKAEQMFNSWYGHAQHGSTHNFINGLLAKHQWLHFTGQKMMVEAI